MNQMPCGNTEALERHQNEVDRVTKLLEDNSDYIATRAREIMCVEIGKGDIFATEALFNEKFTPGDYFVLGGHLMAYYTSQEQKLKDLRAEEIGKQIIKLIESRVLEECTKKAEQEIIDE